VNGEYLTKPELAQLWAAARVAWERNGGLAGEARLNALTEPEALELDGLLTWLRRRPRTGATLKVPLPKLDARIRESEIAPSLQAVLEELGGSLRDRPAERATAAAAWEQIWADAHEHPAARSPDVGEWLQRLRRSGALKKVARGNERATLLACLDVLAALPREGVELSRLASELLGDPHALDYDTALSGLVGGALAASAGRERPRSAAEWRAEWAQVGVLCDALSCTALALGLRPISEGAVAESLRLLADAGEPAVLTLRQLSREALTFAPETVYVCENPAVVNAAAEALGDKARPLMCGAGWPNTAVSVLLEHLQASGCQLRYQGDFDAEGVRIGQYLRRRHGVTSWRFDVSTYAAALRHRPAAPSRPLPQNGALVDTISAGGDAAYEEDIVDALVADLRLPSANQ
jgi:uncharacterized protein (TIGR02679 family)